MGRPRRMGENGLKRAILPGKAVLQLPLQFGPHYEQKVRLGITQADVFYAPLMGKLVGKREFENVFSFAVDNL